MKRDFIVIDENLCNGCGVCVEGCHEGALQLIDGKARVVSEMYCDGLGACIGECPLGAISVVEQEVEPYNELAVIERIAQKGKQTIIAHLKHLKDYNELEYLKQGVDYIKSKGIDIDLTPFAKEEKESMPAELSYKSHFSIGSQLTHWPIQLHLINPMSNHFIGADIVLAADCVAYSYANFHSNILSGKKLLIACPKLDDNKDVYIDKLVAMIDEAEIKSLTVVIMEVPCCRGLMQLASLALQRSKRDVQISKIVITRGGELQ